MTDPADARLRVLLVDDEPPLVHTLAMLLRDEFVVETASSGPEALARLQRARDVDAIVCDLTMPRVSGIDIYEWLAGAHPGVERRMIFMTGGSFTPRAAKFVKEVPNPIVDKPFGVDALVVLVRGLVEQLGRISSP